MGRLYSRSGEILGARFNRLIIQVEIIQQLQEQAQRRGRSHPAGEG